MKNPTGDVQRAVDLLFESSGIEVADKLSIDHINMAVDSLKAINYPSGEQLINLEEPYMQSLIGLALKVKTRKY